MNKNRQSYLNRHLFHIFYLFLTDFSNNGKIINTCPLLAENYIKYFSFFQLEASKGTSNISIYLWLLLKLARKFTLKEF